MAYCLFFKILKYTTNFTWSFILCRVIIFLFFFLLIHLNTTKICNLHKLYTRCISCYIKTRKNGTITARKRKKKKTSYCIVFNRFPNNSKTDGKTVFENIVIYRANTLFFTICCGQPYSINEICFIVTFLRNKVPTILLVSLLL